eukprot:11753372-Heterocapsa_arctica.AAC.1
MSNGTDSEKHMWPETARIHLRFSWRRMLHDSDQPTERSAKFVCRSSEPLFGALASLEAMRDQHDQHDHTT